MQYFDVSDSEIHPAYNAANLHNNIGILIMPENIPPFLALPISLPPDNIISSPMYTYYGFGITDPSDFNSIPDIVKMGHTNSLPQEACIAIFGGQLITNGTWCGGQFMSSLCHGDQGGPVIHVLLNYLVGLSNFWMNPCNSGNPDVFVRVDYHITWINTIIAAPIS
ncbi:brachyurin-like [Phlebotomus argentipes]|uniref:brachyurin-like n=1 Tax=Phlebotomus argentipes TaxID=94469 RepID=UPI002893730F|nr:brachyurin-like [Phlebotomus argentipes]